MILEYTGRHLALMELAAQVKLLLYAVLVTNVFFPWGIAVEATPRAWLVSVTLLTVKLTVLGTCLAVAETAVAKMRLFKVPTFLVVAFTVALVGMLSAVILEGSV
jgi:formate hydrogenlyase subunit 4